MNTNTGFPALQNPLLLVLGQTPHSVAHMGTRGDNGTDQRKKFGLYLRIPTRETSPP